MDDEYHTIRAESSVETKVQGSRFIGEAVTVSSVEDAQRRLEKIRKREFAATHHCYAWRIGRGREITFKYSDDGEPNGTAGKPILDTIAGGDLTDTLLVVTRYFGGTKLGTGGLVHAYSEAAQLALERAGRTTKFINGTAAVTLEFPLYDRWMKIVQKLGATVIDSAFAENVTMKLSIRLTRLEELRSAFVELTSGRGQIEISSESTEGH